MLSSHVPINHVHLHVQALPDLRQASAAVLVLLLARLIQTPLLLLLHMHVQLQVFFSAPVFLPFAF